MGKLQKSGPLSSCVKNPQYFDFAGTYTIRDDIRRSRNDEPDGTRSYRKALGAKRLGDEFRGIAGTRHHLPRGPVRRRRRSHAEVSRAPRIGKLYHYANSQSLDVPVKPGLAGQSRPTVVVNLIRRPVHDINAAAIGPPPGNARREVLVRVSDAPVVLFLELVL